MEDKLEFFFDSQDFLRFGSGLKVFFFKFKHLELVYDKYDIISSKNARLAIIPNENMIIDPQILVC